MPNYAFKLRYEITGLVSLPTGGTMEITIPAGSLVNILSGFPDITELTRVQYGERTCAVSLRELQRCGTPLESSGA
jgi:hypothetical protein